MGTPQKKLGRFEVKNVPEEILARLTQPAKQVGALACLCFCPCRAVPCPALLPVLYAPINQPRQPN